MNTYSLIAFDADDTLWENEPFYREAEQELERMLTKYAGPEDLTARLYKTEKKNLRLFGYGAKGFTLSMIESAIELSRGDIKGLEIQKIIDMGKALLNRPIKLLPQVGETVQYLAQSFDMMIISKGDLFDQESKIARSGLADYFKHIEIVSEKNKTVYSTILKKYKIKPQNFLMVGNSLRSDILPVLQIGADAMYIPFKTTWIHEQVPEDQLTAHSFTQLNHIGELISLLETERQ